MSLPSLSRSLIRQKTEPIKDDSDSKSSIAMTWDRVRLTTCSVLLRRTEADRNGLVKVAAWKEVVVDVDIVFLPGASPLCRPGFFACDGHKLCFVCFGPGLLMFGPERFCPGPSFILCLYYTLFTIICQHLFSSGCSVKFDLILSFLNWALLLLTWVLALEFVRRTLKFRGFFKIRNTFFVAKLRLFVYSTMILV